MPPKEINQVLSDSSNQWEHQGDCSICRKQSYCKSPCKPVKLKNKPDIDELNVKQNRAQKRGNIKPSGYTRRSNK